MLQQTRSSLLSPQSETASNHGVATVNPSAHGQNSLTPFSVKRTRSRSSRGSSSGKRVALSANKQVADPVEEEEMQRTIQHIVAKALEVSTLFYISLAFVSLSVYVHLHLFKFATSGCASPRYHCCFAFMCRSRNLYGTAKKMKSEFKCV